MTLQKILILFLTLLIISCNASNDIEESLIIYSTEKQAVFLKILDEQNVNYRIQDDGQIFYSITQKDIVIGAFEEVMGNKIPDLQPSQNSPPM